MRLHLISALLPLAASTLPAPVFAKPNGSSAVVTQNRSAESDPAIRELATALEENFVFVEVGKAYAQMLRSKLEGGAYRHFPDLAGLAEQVTADLRAAHNDRHLRVELIPPEAKAGRPAGEMRQRPQGSAVTKSGWLAPDVAYIRFSGFPGNQATKEDVRKFLETHEGARSLIVDLRDHRGGGLSEVDLILSHMFDKETVLLAMDVRRAVEERHGSPIPPQPFIRIVPGPDQVVRREHFVVPAAGSTNLKKAQLFVLISGGTASAGEHFAMAVKRTGRGTLVGERTLGAGHFGGMFRLSESLAAFIPAGRTFDPDTNQGWEDTGIAPDIEVPADKALDEALRLANARAEKGS